MSLFALVRNSVIETFGPLPKTWHDGIQEHDLRDGALAASLGWLRVVQTAKPPDTEAGTFDWSLALVGGVPTVVWVERAWTADELESRRQTAVTATLMSDAVADNPNLMQAIADLQVLLANNTTVGSIRSWRSQDNAVIVTASSLKALADLVLSATQANRRVARATLRVAKLTAGDYSSADVGDP